MLDGKSMLDPLSLSDHASVKGKKNISITVTEVEPDYASEDSDDGEELTSDKDEFKKEEKDEATSL